MNQDGNAYLQAYLDEFNKLKERKRLKEVLEREMLLAFIRANMNRIAEFPLLETEQTAIIDLICQRALDHPCQEYIKTWLGIFLVSLNHYAKSKDGAEPEQQEKNKTALFNAEKILIQCVQGAVYAAGLTKDNIFHAIVGTLGADSLPPLQELTKTMLADDNFWRAVLDSLVIERIAKAYEEILSGKRYSLTKDEAFVVLRFHLDDILRYGGAMPVEVEKTRIQTAFEEIQLDTAGRKRITCITHFLQNTIDQDILKQLNDKELAHAGQVVCMDDISAHLCSRLAPSDSPPSDANEEANQEPLEFLRDQALAMAVGATIAASIVKQDFLRALKELTAGETKVLSETMGNMERLRMRPALGLIFEFYLCHHLRELAGEDAAKLQLRTVRSRRVPKNAVEALASLGLNRIRQKKFFADDVADQESMLFSARTPTELQKLLAMFQVEDQLLRSILQLWRDASVKVDILAAINLKQLAKVTTNLPQRVAEILTRLGIAMR